jgi:HK97 gp10 family phage protein
MDFKVSGLQELEKRLIEIGTVAGTKAMRSALFTATKPILEQAQATAPTRSGALKQALARTFSVNAKAVPQFGDFGVSSGGSLFSVSVGPKVKNRTAIALYNLVYKRRRPRRGIYHGHFLEFGTKRGTKATHWLERALRSRASEATTKFAEALKKRIEAATRKR